MNSAIKEYLISLISQVSHDFLLSENRFKCGQSDIQDLCLVYDVVLDDIDWVQFRLVLTKIEKALTKTSFLNKSF